MYCSYQFFYTIFFNVHRNLVGNIQESVSYPSKLSVLCYEMWQNGYAFDEMLNRIRSLLYLDDGTVFVSEGKINFRNDVNFQSKNWCPVLVIILTALRIILLFTIKRMKVLGQKFLVVLKVPMSIMDLNRWANLFPIIFLYNLLNSHFMWAFKNIKFKNQYKEKIEIIFSHNNIKSDQKIK